MRGWWRQLAHSWPLSLTWQDPAPAFCPEPGFPFILCPGGFPGKSPPCIFINLHQSSRELHKKRWRLEEALSTSDPVSSVTGNLFLAQHKQSQTLPLPLLPFRVQVCFEIYNKTIDWRQGLILASVLLISITLGVCTHSHLT